MSGDYSSLSLQELARETVFHPFPLASPSGTLYIERIFFLRLCINKSIHYLRLYRSLYSNIFTQYLRSMKMYLFRNHHLYISLSAHIFVGLQMGVEVYISP